MNSKTLIDKTTEIVVAMGHGGVLSPVNVEGVIAAVATALRRADTVDRSTQRGDHDSSDES